jgi:hypothetical protein
MRFVPMVLLGIVAACGGTPKTTTTPPPPTNHTPPPVTDAPKPVEPAVDKSVCANRPSDFGPVALDESQVKKRYGTNARTYADAPSTKTKPIEVCGIPASREWLRSTTCKDGSPAKQNGRTGSVGSGGRCGSIIDLYTVTCPEGDHEVFIDIYMCGPNEALR